MKKLRPVVSLRVLLLLLVGLLASVALVFAAFDLQRSLVIYRDAGRLAERNQIADACLQAVQNFAFERGRSNVVLHGSGPISQESRAFIEARRAAAETRIAELLARLQALPRDGAQQDWAVPGEALRAAWLRVSTLRRSLERDFVRRLAERDPTLADRWLVAADDLVARLEALLIEVSAFPGEVDVGLERLSTLRTLALQLRNLLGSESSVFATNLLSGRTPSREAISRAMLLRGASTQVWSQLDVGLRHLADTQYSAALAMVRSELFDRLRPLQDQMVAAAAAGRGAAVDGERYLAASTSTLNASVGLADAISEATAAHTRTRLERARREALTSAASIVVILLLWGLVVMVLLRRFTRPLNEVMGRLDALLGGQPGLVRGPLASAPGDEFGRVAQALEILDEVLLARARSEAALHESERMSASILASVPLSIIATDTRGLITVFSPGAEAMLGYGASEMIGKQTPMVLHDGDEVRARAETLSNDLGRVVAVGMDTLIAMSEIGAKSESLEWTYVRKDGARITVLLTRSVLRNARGEIDGYLGVATDVTERALAAAEISRMAHHDQLTRLPNRRLFHDRMQVAITQSRRESARLALMLVDLDGFKGVNDRLGHPVGDLLLKAVAKRMLGCLRESDTLARVGGDEFAVILPRVGEAGDALVVAEKIRLALNAPFDLAGAYPLSISGSIGVAIYPEHGKDEKRLAKNADEAMYLAKAEGGNCARLFGRIELGTGEAGDGELVRLTWEKGYQCGEPSIDRGHYELFELANDLIDAVQSGQQDGPPLSGRLDLFLACMEQHFADEEALLSNYHYGGLAEHALLHQRLVDGALDLRQRIAAGDAAVGDLVTFLVHEVVVAHMLEDDLMFFSLLNKLGGSAAVADHEH